ncbi:hypothetical protein ACI65C_008123 [Semiaphis heraclei]
MIDVPKNWFRSNEIAPIDIAFHTLSTFKSNYSRYIEKQLIIKNDSKIILLINNKIVTPHEIGLKNSQQKNLIEFQSLFNEFDKIKCCQGAFSSTENKDIRASYGPQYIESCGQWRHIQCSSVLKNALTVLHTWELNVANKLLSEDDFLTKQTAEGLKITIKSTIELTNYLLDECNFAYVLTSKTNQDCLEKFFGTIRQVAGPNDHPTTPTFLQLYRMLSVYSIIKPPKSGNCCILEENIPVITITDLKTILNDKNDVNVREVKINNLKQKIDCIVEEGQWNFEDVFSEHNYSDVSSTAFECAVYFMAGYINKRLIKKTKCETCLKSLQTIYGISSNPAADLVNLKTRGFLTHPNHYLFKLLESLELCFMKLAESSSPFDDTHEEFFQAENITITFPCNIHKTEIITEIFIMYITMRMRQYSYTKNQEAKKLNKTKKKISKLVSS